MKYILSAILVFMVTVGMSYAEPEERPVKPDNAEKIEKTKKQERFRRMRSKSYSRQLNALVARSGRLVSDQSQKTELNKIRDEIVPSLSEKEKEYRMANSEILKSLSNADFDASEVKKEFEKTQALQTAVFDEYLEGLVAIKKIIGDDNYNALYNMTKRQGKKPKTDGGKKKDKEKPKIEPEKKPAEEDAEAK